MRRLLAFSCLSSAVLFTGCGGRGASPVAPTTVPAPVPAPTNATTIKHIVVIMQENRTFDNLFNGFPGADTVASGMNHGVVVPLQPAYRARRIARCTTAFP